jgi:hypothetical protein
LKENEIVTDKPQALLETWLENEMKKFDVTDRVVVKASRKPFQVNNENDKPNG